MDAEAAFAALKQEYPELEEGVLRQALLDNDYDIERAKDALRAKYYNEETGIAQESSFWSSIIAPFAQTEGTTQSHAATTDWSIESFQDGVTALGMQLVSGVDVIADTIGSISDLIPELLFGADGDEEGYNGSGKRNDKEQVVVGSSRSSAVKKRGTPGGQNQSRAPPPPVAGTIDEDNEYDDEEDEDWTKED